MSSNCNYLYGVVPNGGTRNFGSIGLDGSEVRTVSDGAVGIVAGSAVPITFSAISPERTLQYLAQHQRVLEQVMLTSPVIPLKFGTYADDEAQVFQILRSGRSAFAAALEKYARKVEVDLAAFWTNLKSVLAEIAGDQAVVSLKSRATGAAGPTAEQCIHLGQLVKQLLDDRRGRTSVELIGALQARWPDTIVNPARDDLMVLNAAILIDRDEQAALDDAIRQLDRRYDDRISFRCVGPLPPYSFATVEVKTTPASRLDSARQSLGLSESASLAEIKAAHRRLLQELHPDRNPDPAAADRLAEVSAAYEFLEEFAVNFKHAFGANQESPTIVKVRSLDDLRSPGNVPVRRESSSRSSRAGVEAA